MYLKLQKIYVRRGGPKYKEALADFRELAEKYNLTCEVYIQKWKLQIVSLALDKKEKEELTLPEVHNIDINLDFYTKYIKYDLEKDDQCIIYSYQPSAVQRMLDFDYVNGRDKPSIAAVIKPRIKKLMDKFFWGSEPIC